MLFLLVLLIAFLTITCLIGKHNENYWKKRGVTFHEKNKVMGVFWDFLTRDRPLFENLFEIYKKYPHDPVVGIGLFLRPLLYVRDPIIIRHVLSTDFNSFNHRGLASNKDDLLSQNLLFLRGRKWKLIRQSVTPLFTPNKLKSMYYIIDKSAQDFIHYLKNNPKVLKNNVFHTLSTFCSAVIGAAVFGVTTESIFDSPFLGMVQRAFQENLRRNMKFAIGNMSPYLFKLLKVNYFKESETFFIDAIKQAIRLRKTENVERHDFVDICISLQNNGTLKDSETGYELEPTDEILAAQAFFFFVAGVEPTAAVMFGTLVELGKNPEIQQRLHEEIDKSFKENNGKMTYDTIVKMEYLEMVVYEAMRMHPPVGFLSRRCTEDTVLPNGSIKISKGTKILTAVYEIHHDPKYYPDPETFNPERFSRGNINTVDMVYMPFGKGNRTCIGIKYALLQAKSGLVHLLRNFSFKTIIYKDRPKYMKDIIRVRLSNVDLEFVSRV